MLANRLKKLIAGIMTTAVVVGTVMGLIPTQTINAATLAKPSDIPTEQSMMDVLSVYNPDAYYFMDYQIKQGRDILAWYRSGNSLIETMDTAVHETYHGYTHYGNFGMDQHYLDSNHSYELDSYSSYFYTEEMAVNIPENLRTFRYQTYVSEGSYASSNRDGFVGLMNEFAAYYWGLNTMDSLIQYLKDYDGEYEDWREYVVSLGNGMTAYSEFKYWLLGYMIYASEHHPDTYQTLLNDKQIMSAYAEFETRFATLINNSIDGIDSLNSYLSKLDVSIRLSSSGIYIGYSGVGLGDYYAITEELSKPEYIAMDKTLKEAAGVKVTPGVTTSPKPTTNPTSKPTIAPTTKPTVVPTTAPTAKPTTVPSTSSSEKGVAAFVERLYTVALGRASDAKGKADWVDRVTKKGYTGAQLAEGFLYSPEFLGKSTSDSEFLDVLYATFFNRPADAAGKSGWLNLLATGTSREKVIRGFIDSIEFANLCLDYGIASGSNAQPNKSKTASAEIYAFVDRLYDKCLGRAGDANGRNGWASDLANMRRSGSEVAYGFFFSTEFINRNVSDEMFVTLLYRVFMDREPDTAGFIDWVVKLKSGTSRKAVFDGFTGSQEWIGICASYGILK